VCRDLSSNKLSNPCSSNSPTPSCVSEPPSDSPSGLLNLNYNTLVKENKEKGVIQRRDISVNDRITSMQNALFSPPLAHQPFTDKGIRISFALLSAKLFKTPTPIDVDAFAELTVDYPNAPIRDSFVRLFTVGSSGNIRDLDRPLTKYPNHGSVLESCETVQKDIKKNLEKGWKSEISSDVLDILEYGTINPIGLVHRKGKARLIDDLSYPKGDGNSVNDHIENKDYGPVTLDSIRIIAADLRRTMTKNKTRTYVTGDATSYYRNFPRHPRDQVHQMSSFQGKTYLNHCECFGDRGAPARCCLFGDILCWILHVKYGIQNPLHYVDNFINPTDDCLSEKDNVSFKACCAKIGLPLNDDDEYVGSTPIILGFQVNGAAGTISIPTETRLALAGNLDTVLKNNTVSLGELRTLVGKLIWTSAIATLGYIYAHKALQQMDAMKNESRKFVVDLSLPRFKETRKTLTWFAELLIQWCGIAVYRETRWEFATSFYGCSGDSSPIGGAFTTPFTYSFWLWCDCGCAKTTNIMRLELASILIGLSTGMAPLFSGRLVAWMCDCGSAVSAFNKGYADDDMSSAIVAEARQILISAQTDDFRLMWTGRKNISFADSLTRGSVTAFLKKSEMDGADRTFCSPNSSRTVKLLPRLSNSDPYVYGFSSHH
jgi:hypothetical protein